MYKTEAEKLIFQVNVLSFSKNIILLNILIPFDIDRVLVSYLPGTMKDILWKYARIYIRKGTIWKIKKKGLKGLFHFGFGYIYTKSTSRSYPPSFEWLFFHIGKYLVTRVDRIPISSWKLSCKISIFFNIVVVVTTVDIV